MQKINIITQFIDWLENLFERKYGIRSLYMSIFMVPSVCLLILYKMEASRSAELLSKLEKAQDAEKECLRNSRNIEKEVREEVYKELKDIYRTFQDLRTGILHENSQTVEQLKKVEDEIQYIQSKSK